jgi:hypothetical protein
MEESGKHILRLKVRRGWETKQQLVRDEMTVQAHSAAMYVCKHL